jgi:uncharacterized protein with von Willebrand factor type A (vWA) domain
MVDVASIQDSPLFLQHILTFCQKLRQKGIRVALHQEIDTCRSLKYIDIFNYDDFYHSLKTNIISCRDDIPVFDEIFSSYWNPLKRKLIREKEQLGRTKGDEDSAEEKPLSPEEKKSREIALADSPKDDSREESAFMETPTYSPTESLQEKDFITFSDEDLETIKKEISLIAKKIRLRESRRKKADNKKTRFFDLRRTIRKNLRYGEDILELVWKNRKVTKTRIVLICDFSGSMECYSRFLIQFLYGLQNSLGHVETFVFSTRLSRITSILRKNGFEKVLDKISRTVLDWSGGTKIGECLRAFNRRYASTLLYQKTIVIIISDGWDRGDEHLLRDEMERLRKKAYYIIWLNPLLGSPQYQPVCKGMSTALPFLDQFLPLHNLRSLIQLGQTLCRIY